MHIISKHQTDSQDLSLSFFLVHIRSLFHIRTLWHLQGVWKVAITKVGIVSDLYLFLDKSVDVAGKALKETYIIFSKNS